MKTDGTNVSARLLERSIIVEEAVNAANAIILEGSDGSVEETNYLTAQVALKFANTALAPYGTTLLTRDLNIGTSHPVVLKDGSDAKVVCPAGMEYCYECGYIDTPQAFLEHNTCPNPNCPNPSGWA